MAQTPLLAQRFSLLFSEIFSLNERLQQLGTEAWFMVEEIKSKVGANANIRKFEDLAKLAANGIELSDGGNDCGRRKRCRWWNRGYCREAHNCSYNHPVGDCEQEGCSGQDAQEEM